MKKIVLDIDNHLIAMDNILSKYMNMPSRLIYVKGIRYPILDRAMLSYTNTNMVSDTPFHPVYSVDMCIRAIESRMYSSSPLFGLYKNNPLIDNFKVFETDIEEIEHILSYTPNIHPIDCKNIVEILNKAYNDVTALLGQDTTSVYKFEYDTNLIVITELMDIRAYRYEEAIKARI